VTKLIAVNTTYPCGCEMTTNLGWNEDSDPYWVEPFLEGCSMRHQATGPTDQAVCTTLLFENLKEITLDY
jgi:hypothetical protein